MANHFDTNNSNGSLVPYLICAGIAFAAGFYVAKKQYVREDLQIVENQNDHTLTVAYKQSSPRQLFNERGIAKLGTVQQRLDDLLNEDPQQIHFLTKELIGHPNYSTLRP